MLVDDHGVVRAGLKSLIDSQSDLEVIGEAGEGVAACRMAEELRPDLVVMDVSMPGMSGDRATEMIKEACPGLKILALTVHEDRQSLRRLLKAGASGYILKLATGEDLLRAMRVVVGGGVYLDPTVAGKVVGEMVQEHDRGPDDEGCLTQREAEVLQGVARGFSNKEIAAQLDISVKTVETHKLRSMAKLKLRSRADVVQFALERSWLASKNA